MAKHSKMKIWLQILVKTMDWYQTETHSGIQWTDLTFRRVEYRLVLTIMSLNQRRNITFIIWHTITVLLNKVGLCLMNSQMRMHLTLLKFHNLLVRILKLSLMITLFLRIFMMPRIMIRELSLRRRWKVQKIEYFLSVQNKMIWNH